MTASVFTLAWELAEKYHKGMLYGDDDYFKAHLRVVSKETTLHLVDGVDPLHAQIGGLLHDILEDTDCTVSELVEIGVPEEVIEAVKLVTKEPGYDESQYFKRIRENELARVIKLADMSVNLHNSIRGRHLKRIMKYTRQLPMLIPAEKMKKMCEGCPYNYGSEATEMAANLGCLPDVGEINKHVGDTHAWPCHSEPHKVCKGFRSGAKKDQSDLPLKPMEGVHG